VLDQFLDVVADFERQVLRALSNREFPEADFPRATRSPNTELEPGSAPLSTKFRPPDIADFLDWNRGFSASEVRTNTCPVFLACRRQLPEEAKVLRRRLRTQTCSL
jgi:hypothetical protein